MPTYQYVCKNCGYEMEELQKITDPPLVRCPNCNTDSLARVIGGGSGVIFKGSGFYLTDYKKKASKGSEESTKGTKTEPETGDKKKKS